MNIDYSKLSLTDYFGLYDCGVLMEILNPTLIGKLEEQIAREFRLTDRFAAGRFTDVKSLSADEHEYTSNLVEWSKKRYVGWHLPRLAKSKV